MTTRNQRDLDDLLDDDGGELGWLYRRLPRAQPPRRLDRQVLAEASRAVHGRPRGARWLIGFGTAAGVLLAAGIAWRVNTDLIRQREGASLSAPASAPAMPPPTEVISVQAHDAPAARATGSARISSKGFDSVESEAAAPSPVAAQAAQESNRSRRMEAANQSAAATRMQAAEPPATGEGKAFPAPPPPAAPPAPGADAAASRMDALQKSEAPGGTAMQASKPAGVVAAESANAAAVHDLRERAKAALPSADATTESRIARIRALLAEGRRDAAVAALRELRREHPDLVLPDDLRALER